MLREGQIELSEYKDKKIIVYFYTRKNTSRCTKEAIVFKDNLLKQRE
jgi:peroxiredoxin